MRNRDKMKKIISIILVLGLLICICGCEKSTENIESDFAFEVPNIPNEDSVSAGSSKQKDVSSTETPVIKNQLPEVKFSAKNNNVQFKNMKNISNGDFAVSGVKYTDDKIISIIQIFDKNSNLKNEYSYENREISKIAVCSDGGFLVVLNNPLCIIKTNSKFETQWSLPFKDDFWGGVLDIEEVSPNCITVLFADWCETAINHKILYIDENGKHIETTDLKEVLIEEDYAMHSNDIITDGHGGFYLLSNCNKSLVDNFSLVAENYDNSKATEAIIMHFSSNRELIWVKTLGGGGDDWIEEATIDSNGNFYLAVGTNWYGADSFWEMGVERTMPYRRMLVKLDKNGNIVYKVPLSAKGMAVDHIFGIHIKDSKAYVVGMTDYFDGYQVKYPCEQILPEEKQKGERVFCVFNACIDGDGNELNRKIFRCDINNEPCDSALLLNGSLVIAGRVSVDENPFNLKFPSGVNSAAALFVYKE